MSPKSSPPKTPVNGKNLKQGTLFSFFNKKPEKSLATSPPVIKTSTAATRVSCKTSFVTPSNDDSDPLPSSLNKARSSNPQTWEKISIGMRIAVYWKEDGKYYEAKVTGRKNNNLKSEFSLEYDNGETEYIDLATEKFRFIDDDEPPEKKRRIIADDESEEEFEFQEEDDDDEAEAKEWVKEDNREEDWMVTDDEDESQVKPKTKANKTKSQKSIKVVPVELSHTPSPKKSQSSFTEISPKKSFQSLPIAVNKADNNQSIAYVDKEVNPAGAHVHNHLEFLRNPKDNKGRARDHPGYDPRTIKVNYTELESHLGGKISPGVQQWWDIKAQYFDTVLLFKTGKFYEMFHMDADIGVQLLDFCYMKGKVAHAGFPEVSYGYFADRLVRAGYKVARVEQTETPEMLADRKKKTTGKKPQVVNREVCSILTLGTRTFCYLDDIRSLESDEGSSVRPLLAIKETLLSESEDGPVCEYGITLVDAARAVINIGQFADDILRSRMNTLLTSFEPSEVSYRFLCLFSLFFI
jgi:DNA mismatch repair protein MSH6